MIETVKEKNKQTHLLKHIVISNLIMLLIPFAAVNFDLFSNQIYLLHQKEVTTKSEILLQDLQFQKPHLIDLSEMPFTSRYILSHCQFDGIHFLTNRYNHQPNFAFIRGYTFLIQTVRYLAQVLVKFIEATQTINHLTLLQIQVIILVLINKIVFVFSAYKLKALAFNLSDNQERSQLIAKIFVYNPACVFFHSVYTQSIYTFFSFSAIFYLLKSNSEINKNYIFALGYFLLASFFRTNAIFLAPVFGVPIIFQLALSLNQKRTIKSISLFLKGSIILIIMLLPLLWYQYFAYTNICSCQVDILEDKQLRNQCLSFWPNLYSLVQYKFWTVGFFSYWKSSNLIFIVLGLPAIIICLTQIQFFFKDSLSFVKSLSLAGQENAQIDKIKQKNKETTKLGLWLSFGILMIVTITLTNLQSSTRFLSSHMLFYVILEKKIRHKIVKFWNGIYLIFGGVLYGIGFPWT